MDKPLKTLNFGGEDTYILKPDWENIDDKPFEVTGGDTLTWDGNTEGLEGLDDLFFHVSDIVVSASDCANGISIISNDGQSLEISGTDMQAAFLEGGIGITEVVFFIPADNYEFNGVVIPKAGIYLLKQDTFYTSSLTINGYTGFTTTKLKPEYLPDSVQTQLNSLSTEIANKAASSHNQAASTITAGTFAGQVIANGSGQTPATSLLRNSKLVSADTNPTVNGEICWTYE